LGLLNLSRRITAFDFKDYSLQIRIINKDGDEMENSKWTNRDWKWLAGIFIGIIIELMAVILSKYNLGDYISFASTIVSIILAIIAIQYAFLESKKASESNTQLQNILHEIDSRVLQLGQAISEIEKMKKELMNLKNDSKLNFDNLLNEFQNYHNISSKIFEELRKEDTKNPEIDKIEMKFNKEFELIKFNLTLALSTLANEEERVLRLRFGLDDGQALSIDEVAKKMNLSNEEVEKIEINALRKLRKVKLKDVMADTITF
jgi:DNA-directed RNA polymerase sigma subunit (sigma70/sigma32)